MQKTPVSILQEMMVKSGTVPTYDLIHDGGGTHVNVFTFRVSCTGLSATGTGRCKKDAKHEAAKNMLKAIAQHRGLKQLPASPMQSPVRTPLPEQVPASPKTSMSVPFVNTIGALQDLCTENNLEEPKYEVISDVGPPHAKVFTMRCTVSTFKEEGIATTKKQAKHEAARKMLDRLSDVVSELKTNDDSFYTFQSEESKRQVAVANELAKARYPELAKIHMTRRVNLGVKISEYHIKLKTEMEEDVRKELLEKLNNLEVLISSSMPISTVSSASVVSEFCNLLESLNIEFVRLVMTIEEGQKVIVIRLSTCPAIVQVGYGDQEAEADVDAIKMVVNSFKILLQ